MAAFLLAFLLLAPQNEDRSKASLRQQRELGAEIADLERSLKATEDPSKRKRLAAALDRLRTRLQRMKEGKIRPESDEPENEEEELAAILKNMDARLKANPSDIDAMVERAEVLMELGRTEAALKDLKNAASIEPGEPFIHMLQGRAFLRLKNEKEAKAAFTRAIEIEPGVRGDIREMLHDLAPERMDSVMSAMNKMMAPKPIDIDAVNAKLRANPKDVAALILRARHSRQQNRIDAAFEDLYTALEIEPTSAAAYFERALAHASRGRMDRAERDFVRGERNAKPQDFRLLRQVEREMRRLEYRMDERRRSPEDVQEQIASLQERLKELEPLKDPDAQTQIHDIRTEIARLNKLRESRPESGEGGWEGIERMHEQLERHEEKMRALARKARAATDDSERTKLNVELRAQVARFHELRHEVMQKEIKAMRDEMEDLKFEIREYRTRKKQLIEETLENLAEEEEE